jgi:cbb3-type cytochrome oxidase cytochrome c subunit
MAASDKPFRNQRSVDIVFAVSNILMLLSCIWMLWDDYAREYKTEQRAFREVEVAMAQQAALASIPSLDEFKAAEAKVAEALEARKKKLKELDESDAALKKLQPQKERAEARYQFAKADVDSKVSFLNIAKEQGNSELANRYAEELKHLNEVLAKEQAGRDDIADKIRAQQMMIAKENKPLNDAVGAFKKVNDRFDAQVKLAINKRWTIWDALRTMPVINGFADPLKIQQFTINDVPIDYNFKYVTRFDRCMSCHVGIDRPSFTKSNLEALTKADANQAKLAEAKDLYDKRVETLKDAVTPKDIRMIPNPHLLHLASVPEAKLTKSRISEFAGHPRLDLYVGSNSKHPAEKLGCSACHYGQGSGTSFLDASHSPNDSKTRETWNHERGWEPNHMWDFPMLPTRFIESSCLKCHHEVTDLISTDNRVEAPKLLRGYALIKENGCFGCHEINGWKSGQRIGPDLRLEPTPPLEDMNALERARAEADPDNRPGTLRKVGPALTRVSEKVSEEWIKKWLYSPSSFRPDTKMPHYYNQSTNSKEFLKKIGSGQEEFPNTEIASIAYFLTTKSKEYLNSAAKHHGDDAQARHKDEMRLMELLNLGRLSKTEKEEFDEVKMRIKLRTLEPLVDKTPKGHQGNQEKGRVLFTERGCLACHAHDGTEVANDALKIPALKSDAVFGPNLSQLKDKLVPDRAAANKWLVQWIMDPHLHSPRSRMPVTHLNAEEAADVAAWLLAQPADKAVGADWAKNEVTEPNRKDLEALAKVYLTRMMSKADMEKFVKGQLSKETAELISADIPQDEKDLYKNINDDNYLKAYLGKKAVSRLGCYGCHDIPGFENAKSIGVTLNDWGKKAPERLAFEDIHNFYEEHYYPVESLTGKDGVKVEGDKTLEPYEKFYSELLLGHNPQRSGYLNQKVRDPRSYDYNRILSWDDRSRMPKFNFARPRKAKDEEPTAFQARVFKDEAEAREAVATFILGLTAEMVPTKSINQPMHDRLAEVKGRQVLDKYNCNGCHLIRPGVYDFKLGPKTLARLDFAYKAQEGLINKLGVINFPNQNIWVGRNPVGADRLTAHGVHPALREIANQDDVMEPWMLLTLSEALKYTDDKTVVKNVPSSTPVFIALEDLHPNPASIKSDADLDRYFGSAKPFGGAFSDLLVPYLAKRDPKKYPLSEGDSADARASLPPVLIGQGDRTQADWLYQFLLNPQKVRKLAILRMPKFNMSKEEAKVLVDYFAAVSRQTNPGVGLPYPFESLPQQDDIDSPYWRQKTKEYVARLRKTKATDMDGKLVKGKDGKEMTSFQQRVEELTPLWEKISKQQEAALKAELQKLGDLAKVRADEIEAKTKLLKTEKGKEADLQKEIDLLKQMLKDGVEEKIKLAAALERLDVKTLQEAWEEKEAYAADAYRMLTSRKLCLQCHQVGSFAPSEKDKQGPPLALASQRLRPNWVVTWVNQPQRLVPYSSLMPSYFSEKELKWQPIHTGPALEQLHALRDVLMNYPRIADLPINRLYNPDLPADRK